MTKGENFDFFLLEQTTIIHFPSFLKFRNFACDATVIHRIQYVNILQNIGYKYLFAMTIPNILYSRVILRSPL